MVSWSFVLDQGVNWVALTYNGELTFSMDYGNTFLRSKILEKKVENKFGRVSNPKNGKWSNSANYACIPSAGLETIL